MITKEQAINAHEFHWSECRIEVGPRGGERHKNDRWRRNGRTQVWITRPTHFRIPIKRGLRTYSNLVHSEASMWHTAEDCKPTIVNVGKEEKAHSQAR